MCHSSLTPRPKTKFAEQTSKTRIVLSETPSHRYFKAFHYFQRIRLSVTFQLSNFSRGASTIFLDHSRQESNIPLTIASSVFPLYSSSYKYSTISSHPTEDVSDLKRRWISGTWVSTILSSLLSRIC